MTRNHALFHVEDDSTTVVHTSWGSASFQGDDTVAWTFESIFERQDVLVGVCIIIILLSGICAGLTLGLLSLDSNDVEILKRSGNDSTIRAVRRIEPLLQHPHILLVALLLVNALCMEALPLFLDRLLDPVSAIVISVTVILLFGEILPQAVCKKYGIQVASSLSWLVQGMIFVTYPISYPIARLLDVTLGHGNHALFRRNEIQALVEAHGEYQDDEQAEYISRQEAQIVDGTLRLYEKPIVDCMTPMDHVYSIHGDDVYDDSLELDIIASGHSRVPVLMNEETNKYACLLVKELLLLPKDVTEKKLKVKDIPEMPVLLRDMPVFKATDGKIRCLHYMIDHMRHMAVVVDGNDGDDGLKEPLLSQSGHQPCGVVCLEDILEDVLSQEIIDETDRFRSNSFRQMVSENETNSFKKRLIEHRRNVILKRQHEK